MAWRFGKADTARNNGAEDFFLEEFAKICGNLSRQIGALVVHREQNAFDLKRMAKGIPNAVDGVHQPGNAFEGKELALNWDQHRISRHEGVKREQIEGGRAIDQDVVVFILDSVQVMPKYRFAIIAVYELQIHTDEVLVGWNDLKTLHFGLLDGVCDLFAVHHHVVEGMKALRLRNAQAACQISLGIAVDHENSDFARCQCSREVYGGSRLPDPALLVSDGYGFRHSVSRETQGYQDQLSAAVFHVKH